MRGEAADGTAAVRAVEEEAAQLRRRPRPPGPLHHGQRAARLGAAGVQALPPARRSARGSQERGAGRDGVLGADDGVGPGREAAAAAAPPSAAPRRLRSQVFLLQLPAELLQQRLHARDLRAQFGQRRRAPRARQHGPPAQRRQQYQYQRRHGPRRRRRRRRARLPPPAPSSAARGGAGPARLPRTAVLSTRRPEQLRRAGPRRAPPRCLGLGRGRLRARRAAGGLGERVSAAGE